MHSSQRGHDSAFESGSDFEVDRMVNFLNSLNVKNDYKNVVVGTYNFYSGIYR